MVWGVAAHKSTSFCVVVVSIAMVAKFAGYKMFDALS